MAHRVGAGAAGMLVALGLALTVMFSANPVQAQQYKGAYETTADVPLREGAGNFHKVITILPKGIQINVVGKEGFWLQVESKHGGKPGYID
ncbi:MAG: SH3 domain-containing protein, partial [Candidatus Binatia bacterium]